MTKEKAMATPAAAGPVPEIERLYSLRDRADVLRFLQENPFLISLVREAYDPIQKHFPGAKVFLEFRTDPEDPDDRQLLLSVATDRDASAAVDALERFDHDWWFNAIHRAQGKLCITLGYR